MESTVTLTLEDERRHRVISRLAEGSLTAAQAAEELGRSERQVRRLLAAYRRDSLPSIPHGNRGRKPSNAISPETADQVLALCQEDGYRQCNNHHLAELLRDREGIAISVSSLRRIRLKAGLRSPRKRRPSKHRSRRERKPQAGIMLQIDASDHAWLGEDRPVISLLATIDDATGEVHALFRESEGCLGYMALMQQVIHHRGVPESLYSDRHTIFIVPKTEKLSLEEELAGKDRPLTQFGRAVESLAIRIIPAYSPQAKGRVERLFETFQDRLRCVMHLDNITTIEQANEYLPGFLEGFNAQFTVKPADPRSAYRKAPPRTQLAYILGLHFPRTVANDNTVTFGNKRLTVAPPKGPSYAKKRIITHVATDGQLSFWHQDTRIGEGPKAEGHLLANPTAIARALPEQPITPKPAKTAPKPLPPNPQGTTPAKDHPWRRFPYGKPIPKLLK